MGTYDGDSDYDVDERRATVVVIPSETYESETPSSQYQTETSTSHYEMHANHLEPSGSNAKNRYNMYVRPITLAIYVS